jgi:hypothetical protein
MRFTTVHPEPPPGGLAALSEVVLSAANQHVLDEAMRRAGGPPVWRCRKQAEGRDLLGLAQIAPRLKVGWVEMGVDLRALLFLRVPVPCRPGGAGELVVEPQAVLGLTYPQEALRQALPGYSFLQVLAPGDVWHANVAFGPVRPLCLGASLPAGVRVKELVLMAYGALSMQTVQIDEQDAAGVMNAAAALWWQQNTARAPLSRAPFLSPDD